MSYSISGRTIDRKSPPFIIAEMSGNHRSSLERDFANRGSSIYGWSRCY